jgi:hypothetical protein
MKIKLLTCLFVAGLFGLQQAAAQNYIVIEDFEDPDKITIPINNMTDGNVDNEDAFTVVDNPAPDDVNDSGQVLQFLRAHDGNVWAGFWSIPWDPLDMNEMKYTHYHVWKPRISTVKFKVEGSDDTDDFEFESMEEQTVVEGWEHMAFHYPDASGDYPVIAVMPDFNDPVDLDENIVIYIDNIILSDSPEDPTAVSAEIGELPVQLALRQNYPNPFNPSTSITFELNNPQHVTLNVYDIQGQLITTLVDGQRAAGEHHVTFDAGNLASGMYLYRLETPQRTITRAMTLIK